MHGVGVAVVLAYLPQKQASALFLLTLSKAKAMTSSQQAPLLWTLSREVCCEGRILKEELKLID